MSPDSDQIRTCLSCGLRYPVMSQSAFGIRCPACLGETELTRSVPREPDNVSARVALEGQGRFSVLLDNIRSAWNVGSILRSADGFGFIHVYVCGITPTPEHEAVMKTSLGAERSVPWSYHKDAVQLIQGLKEEGGQVWALEEDQRAVPLSRSIELESSDPVILIVGNEKIGVDPGLLEAADKIIYIPMYGAKSSFNVAIAFGIAAYQLTGLRS